MKRFLMICLLLAIPIIANGETIQLGDPVKQGGDTVYTHTLADYDDASLAVNDSLAVTGSISATANVSGATYGSDSSVSDAELKYINTLSSNAQTQLDARCLESVFGTAIGTGLTLDGTTLKTHAALQSIAGLTETNGGIPYGTADNAYAWLTAGALGKHLMGNGAAAPSWTPYTFPTTVPTTGKVFISNGTNMVESTALGTAAYTNSTAYQVADAELTAIAALATTDGNFIVGSGSTWVAESAATAKTSLGLDNVTNESKATMFTSPTFTGAVSGITSTMVGLGNVTNESKATMFTSPTFTGADVEILGSGSATSLNVRTNTQAYDVILGLFQDFGETARYNGYAILTTANNSDLYFQSRSSNADNVRVVFKNDGKVGIGTTSPGQELHVVGSIYASGGIMSAGAYADYVFEDDYALPKLDELDEFISENKHLPGMTVNKGGTISHNQAIHELLVKVEEQSRYILELHARLKKIEEGK